MNQQDKEAFFALYWNQPVLWIASDLPLQVVNSTSIHLSSRLELKPLSSISDEDAIEVAKMAVPYTGKYEIQEIKNTSFIVKLPFIGCKYQIYPLKSLTVQRERFNGNAIELVSEFSACHNSIKIIDYLRSKGYLIPFRHYSTDQILELGWAKLKEEEV